MRNYIDGAPPHSHRTPSEIAQDETDLAERGFLCGLPEGKVEKSSELALVPWADRPEKWRFKCLPKS